MPKRRIVIDSNEVQGNHLGYRFSGIDSTVKHLETGDYSLEGLEDRVAVERKSKEDAYGCAGKGRTRFMHCMGRLSKLDRACVVIEADLADFAVPPAYTRLSAAQAVGSYVSWMVRFGVPVIFAGNRAYAERVTVRFLEAFEKYCEKGD